jgi:ssDNA-binding Zn-finger/Zn-ribbon topoisomerase 1
MTRVVNKGFAQVVAAHMSKRPISAEKAAAGAADPENPRCPVCSSRTVFIDGSRKRGAYFFCEAGCGWSQSLKRSEEVRAGRGNGGSAHSGDLPTRGPACTSCGGETRLQHGPYGAFYGCARYPHCDGKAPVPKATPLGRGLPGKKRRPSKR